MNTPPSIHKGHNVKRVREILGSKQDALAIQLGLSQQAVSQFEQKETLDAPTMDKIANALCLSADAIRNFNEKATFNIISNNYHDHSSSINHQFGPIEKIALYQRMINEKNELIEKLMDRN